MAGSGKNIMEEALSFILTLINIIKSRLEFINSNSFRRSQSKPNSENLLFL